MEEVKRREDGVGSQFTFYLLVWNISPRQTFPDRVDCRFDKIMILLAPRWQDRNKRVSRSLFHVAQVTFK